MHYTPAWKRIGLKLKRPSESNGPDENYAGSHTSNKKLKLNGSSDSPELLESLGKANGASSHVNQDYARKDSRNTGVVATGLPWKSSGTDDMTDGVYSRPLVALSTASQPHPIAPELSNNTGLKRRKSVTFSPDAKVKDGPLADMDYSELNEGKLDTADIPSAKRKKNKKALQNGEISTEEQNLVTTSEADGREKLAGSSEKPYVAYLYEYHNHKDRWKFNKNLQIQVLKNVFNVYRIPPSHDSMLKAYLSGLRGESRTRLRADADQLLAKIASHGSLKSNSISNSVEGEEAGKAISVNALKQKRAQMVLGAVGQDIETPQKPQSAKPTPTQVGSKTSSKRSRGRKRRTAISLVDDIDTSSDSGSSNGETSKSSSSSSSDPSEDSDSEISSSGTSDTTSQSSGDLSSQSSSDSDNQG